MENPTDDPNLEQALRFFADAESRVNAEAAFNRYLERETDAAQRARAYFRLGYMFAAGSRSGRAEKMDQAKAEEYYRKAIEAVPNGLSIETVLARTQSASIGEDADERFRRRVENYRWLRSIDHSSIASNVLLNPSEKIGGVTVGEWDGESVEVDGRVRAQLSVRRVTVDPKVTRERRVRDIAGLLEDVELTTAGNLATGASESSAPERNLNLLVREFPGTPAEASARRAFRRLGLAAPPKLSPPPPPAPSPPAQVVDLPVVVPSPAVEPGVANDVAHSAVGTAVAQQDANGSLHKLYIIVLIALGVIVLIVGGVVWYHRVEERRGKMA